MYRLSSKLYDINEAIFFILLGLFAGIFIPGDGNPGHIFSIAICGVSGLIFWLRRGKSILATIVFCLIVIILSWPIAIGLRNVTEMLTPDMSEGLNILWWLHWILPLAIFLTGLIYWWRIRNWIIFALAIIPIGILIGYNILRSPITRQIDRIEWLGIMVTASADQRYNISIIHNKTDNVINEAFNDLKNLNGLKSVIIKSDKISGVGICLITKLPEVESITMDSVQISQESLICLAKMPKLRILIMNHVKLRAQDISELSNSRSLKTLEISDCVVGDKIIDYIAMIKTLKNVRIYDNDISIKAIKELENRRPDLQISF
jgi:hypothetical protein